MVEEVEELELGDRLLECKLWESGDFEDDPGKGALAALI